MHDLIEKSSAARALLMASFIAFAVAEVFVRLRNTRVTGSDLKDRGSLLAVIVGIAAGGIAAGWLSAKAPAWEIPGSWTVFGVGIALIWCGIGLRQWAVFTLGRFFTVVVRVSADQHVVARGPFRWVRHPSYTGLLLTLTGVGIAVGNWLSLAALIILPALGLAIRIRVEEAALKSSLAGYREYAEGRPALFPRLW